MKIVDSNSTSALLERAVFKLLVGEQFKGTAFFISPDYLLTAYHCIGDFIDEHELYVKNATYGKLHVRFERDKSFKNHEIDIAVLKLVDPILIADYLPLGLINGNHKDEVIAIGYPAEILSVIPGRIHGFPEKYPQMFFNNVMKAEGQSGGPVYHLATQRVVGLALNVYRPEVVKEGGLAGRFDKLFEQWQELTMLNQQSIEKWEERLPKDQLMKWSKWYGIVIGIIIVLLVIGFIFSGKQKTEGDCSPIVDKTTGNVSLDCSIGTTSKD